MTAPNYDPRLVLMHTDLPASPPRRIPVLVGGVHPATLKFNSTRGGGTYYTFMLRYDGWGSIPQLTREALREGSLGDGEALYTDQQPNNHAAGHGRYEGALREIQFILNYTIKRAKEREIAQPSNN